MKDFTHSGWCRSVFGLIVLMAFWLTVGMAPSAAHAQAICTGDCNGDGHVTIDEILTLVNMALTEPLTEEQRAAQCPDGVVATQAVTIDQVLTAVNIALLPACPSTAVCGNGVTDPGEDCDEGGTCIGGSNAGTHCTAESDCTGNGVCVNPSGLPEEIPCADDAACIAAGQVEGSKCVHCLVQGTATCAANCSSVTEVPFALVPGELQVDGTIKENTSGAAIHGDLTLALPLTGSQTLLIGKEKNGTIPAIIPAASVSFPAIPIQVGGQTLACACVRGIAAKTCGGTVFDTTGGLAKDCTPGYSNNGDTEHDGECPVDLPCTFVHGAGNSATGVVGCNANNGLPVNLFFTQDDTGGGETCNSDAQCLSMSCISDPNGGASNICGAFPPMLTLSVPEGGTPAGGGLLLNSTAIGNVVGGCSNFCTDADPYSDRGTINTLPLTTGEAGGIFTAADGDPGTSICDCGGGVDHCAPSECQGPLTVIGQLLSCENLTGSTPTLSGSCLAGSFTAANQAVLGDAVITNVLCAQ